MNNILLDELPNSFYGYQINTWYQIGIQVQQVYEDCDMSEGEKAEMLLFLLFSNDDGSYKPIPDDIETIQKILKDFMNGWYLDNKVKGEHDNKRLVDYDIDQWRIFSDFMQIYHIDLSKSDMHWWMFQGLLWNMPHEQSSFMNCLEIRTKKPRKGATADEIKAINTGHQRFDLKSHKEEKEFTKEEESKIDSYDKMMEEIKKKKALELFNKM